MNKKNIYSSILVLFIAFCFTYPGYGDYQTPGTGVTYTIDDLVSLSGGDLQLVGDDYILYDKVIISPSDELVVASGTLIVATAEETEYFDEHLGRMVVTKTNPQILIKGSLEASNWTIKPITDQIYTEDDFYIFRGIIISKLGHDGIAQATISNCTFENLIISISVCGEGTAVIEDSTFISTFAESTISTYFNGNTTLRNCEIDTDVVSAASNLTIENCQISKSVYLNNNHSTLIDNCNINGGDIAGIYARGDSGGNIKDTGVSGQEYGVFITSNCTLSLDNCNISDNLECGLVVEGSAVPKLRNCTVSHSSGNVGERPAILILEDGQPDLGTDFDPGNNTINCENGYFIYHAGNKEVNAWGNTWGTIPTSLLENFIYHQPDDQSDDDGSEFISGLIMYMNSSVNYYTLYK